MKTPRILLCFTMILLFLKMSAAYKLDISNIHKGEYSYSYDLDDGSIMEDREGKIDENGDQVVTGSYTFVIGDSQYTVTYTADKNGYHPTITMFKSLLHVPVVVESLDPRAVATLLGG